jgi:RNA polymerase sigma-32 factor
VATTGGKAPVKKPAAAKKRTATKASPSVKGAAKKSASRKPTSSVKSAKAVDAEIIDPSVVEDDAEVSPVLDLEQELPSLDAAIDIDPDRDINEDEFTPNKIRTVNAVLVDSPTEESSKAVVPSSSDPVALYLAEIRKYPLLSREQEQELALRYREHADSKAAEMLVTANLRFVVKVAAEYSRFGAKLIDLIQEGNVGLMHAVKEFNPYKGVRLITYAVWWIRGYIQEYLMRQYSMVRIGTTQNQRKLFYRLQKERQAMDSQGVEPTNALLAGRLGVTEEEVETMTQRLSSRDLSLSAPVDSSGQSAATMLDFEPSDIEGADEQIGHMEEMAVLNDNLAELRPNLTEKETYILEKRILADEPLTLQEIGDHYGVTREAVRQLEARLINRIRQAVTRSLHLDEE